MHKTIIGLLENWEFEKFRFWFSLALLICGFHHLNSIDDYKVTHETHFDWFSCQAHTRMHTRLCVFMYGSIRFISIFALHKSNSHKSSRNMAIFHSCVRNCDVTFLTLQLTMHSFVHTYESIIVICWINNMHVEIRFERLIRYLSSLLLFNDCFCFC